MQYINLTAAELDLLKFIHQLIIKIPDSRIKQDQVLAEYYKNLSLTNYKESLSSLINKALVIGSIDQVYAKGALEPKQAHHLEEALPYSLTDDAYAILNSSSSDTKA